MLLRYLTCRISINQNYPCRSSSQLTFCNPARFAPLLSTTTFSGQPLFSIVRAKKALAAASSRCSECCGGLLRPWEHSSYRRTRANRQRRTRSGGLRALLLWSGIPAFFVKTKFERVREAPARPRPAPPAPRSAACLATETGSDHSASPIGDFTAIRVR